MRIKEQIISYLKNNYVPYHLQKQLIYEYFKKLICYFLLFGSVNILILTAVTYVPILYIICLLQIVVLHNIYSDDQNIKLFFDEIFSFLTYKSATIFIKILSLLILSVYALICDKSSIIKRIKLNKIDNDTTNDYIFVSNDIYVGYEFFGPEFFDIKSYSLKVKTDFSEIFDVNYEKKNNIMKRDLNNDILSIILSYSDIDEIHNKNNIFLRKLLKHFEIKFITYDLI